uniref:Immediate early response 3-interacting protein 1 n=1 Tax=Gasterosteus aculeatus aculeatus TaxID=481459 RepID=G3PJ45_GASAC
MAFTLYSLIQAAILCVNAVAVLHEERFLSKIGWGVDQSVGGFGDEPGVKVQLMNLVRSVRTVMRGLICGLFLLYSAVDRSECSLHRAAASVRMRSSEVETDRFCRREEHLHQLRKRSAETLDRVDSRNVSRQPECEYYHLIFHINTWDICQGLFCTAQQLNSTIKCRIRNP